MDKDISELVEGLTKNNALSEAVVDAFKVIPVTVPAELVTKFALALLEKLSSVEADEPRTQETEVVLEYPVGIL
jgi:hypothetical protein